VNHSMMESLAKDRVADLRGYSRSPELAGGTRVRRQIGRSKLGQWLINR
jgi:hypothetical protein